MDKNNVITGYFKNSANPQVKAINQVWLVLTALVIGYFIFDGFMHPNEWKRQFSTPARTQETLTFLGAAVVLIGLRIAWSVKRQNPEARVELETSGGATRLIIHKYGIVFPFPGEFQAGIDDDRTLDGRLTRYLRLVLWSNVNGERIPVILEEELLPGTTIPSVETMDIQGVDKALRFTSSNPSSGSLRKMVETLQELKQHR